MSKRYNRKLSKKVLRKESRFYDKIKDNIKSELKNDLGPRIKGSDDQIYITMTNPEQNIHYNMLTPKEQKIYFYLCTTPTPDDQVIDLYKISDKFDLSYEEVEEIFNKFIDFELVES